MKFLSGYRTYIVGGLLALVGLVNLLAGEITLTAFLNDPNLAILLNGLGLIALRMAKK